MKPSPSVATCRRCCFAVAMSALIAFTAGCGGSGSGPGKGGGSPTSPTAVTLMLSSTANDQLQQLDLQLESLTLTSKSGNTVNIFSTPPYTNLAEFIHLNGFNEPVLTVSVPQDTYTSATATVASAQFTCTSLDSTGLQTSTFAYEVTPNNQVAVSVPQAIEVDSVPMGISLNLQASPSATYGNCDGSGGETYSIDPTFNLNPIEYGSPDNNLVSVQATTLRGIVASVDSAAGTFTATTADGLTLSVVTSAGTTYQNLSGLSALANGAAVEMDLQLGESGSVAATRVQSVDATPTNLSVVTGPVIFVSNAQPTLAAIGVEQQGFLFSSAFVDGGQDFSFGEATFQVSGYLDNLSKLPFTPVFNASTMVAGQKIEISTHATTMQGGPTYVPATTVTLVPQTINGIVTGITTTGSGTTAVTAYTVSLASYDLFPNLAVQPGQTTTLTSPSIVTVYTVGGAEGVQASVGTPFRFTGLVFNDNGSLKMDCQQILPGVAE